MQLLCLLGGLIGGDFLINRTPRETVDQAIDDFDGIREAIRGHKIEVPYPTKTSEYAGLIAKIRVGAIEGRAEIMTSGAAADTVCGNVLSEINSIVIGPVCGNAQVIDEY